MILMKSNEELKVKEPTLSWILKSVCIEILPYYRYNVKYMYIGVQTGNLKKGAKIIERYKEQHIQKLI